MLQITFHSIKLKCQIATRHGLPCDQVHDESQIKREMMVLQQFFAVVKLLYSTTAIESNC